MSKFGIFYIPDKNLTNLINLAKKHFGDNSKNHKYIEHPVHSSIYVFETKKDFDYKVINTFSKLTENLRPTICKIRGWHIFENDLHTGGLNTLHIMIEPNDELFKIQRTIVDKLSVYHEKTVLLKYSSKKFKKSYDKFGYPFVGNHWIPHLTVGSLDLNIKEIRDQVKNFTIDAKEILVESLELFKIIDDTHKSIKRIEF